MIVISDAAHAPQASAAAPTTDPGRGGGGEEEEEEEDEEATAAAAQSAATAAALASPLALGATSASPEAAPRASGGGEDGSERIEESSRAALSAGEGDESGDEEEEPAAAEAAAPAATAEPSDASTGTDDDSRSRSSTSHGALEPSPPFAVSLYAVTHLSANEAQARRTAALDAGETCGAAEAAGRERRDDPRGQRQGPPRVGGLGQGKHRRGPRGDAEGDDGEQEAPVDRAGEDRGDLQAQIGEDEGLAEEGRGLEAPPEGDAGVRGAESEFFFFFFKRKVSFFPLLRAEKENARTREESARARENDLERIKNISSYQEFKE